METSGCCFRGRRFPTFPVVVLVLGILWLLGDLEVLTVDVPWLPVILIMVAIGWIVNSLRKE